MFSRSFSLSYSKGAVQEHIRFDELSQCSWYQDPGTKILVPKKKESPRGGASRYAGGHGGLQAPQEQQGVWGQQPPSKNNFMNPEPSSDHLQPLHFFWKKVKPIITLPDKVFELSG